ncbi:DegV family protein [Mediterraneibacter glycyrrhizinilyticus]|nr:DegV family protein [Mediterraneibacter glycyrrhizinilyticus]MBM6854568.1 DegV family protein [Mediterraneibacter glycyrrhizinilyticus]
MPEIAIMTDSNCGIMPAEGDKLGIHVLPMPVIIDGQTYCEGIDISLEEFHEKQRSGADITTSQPSPGDVTAMWDDLLRHHDEVVFIPMSSGLSNTCQTAAMLSADEKYEGRVFVVDNHRISVTQAQSVLDAQVLAAEGKTGSSIKKILEEEAMDASIYIAVDTLEYLKKGGRITPAAAAIGTVLKLKPVLTIQGDKLDSFAKTRGMKGAFKLMLDAVKKDIDSRFSHLKDQRCLKVGIANTLMDPEKLKYFKKEMKESFPDMELFYLPLTMSIGTHTGPGALGIGTVRFHDNSDNLK